MTTHSTLALIPLFPLVGFLINGLWYALIQSKPEAKKASSAVTGGIATIAIFASFVVSVMTFMQLQGMSEGSRVIDQHLFNWMSMQGFSLDMALRVDTLSTLFTLVITGVGTLIHLYSVGYMSHDATPGKFFAYLNLFCFAMLMLVMGSSLPILFLGWEGVGVCSYLLIGYWYQDQEKASAGKKAFIVNRVGDLGFLLGMFLIFTTFGTLDFTELNTAVLAGIPAGATGLTITLIGVLLFVGCMGKSAQIPLYVWLPDAMAGPTPVSALIHAATMVTSGVYMLARLSNLYLLSPDAMMVIAVIGGLTAFFAATIAVAQTDIKKVLAYSTVSQLGYMFLACGVGAFATGVFHVITHAFFKALMFLGAGSVIHGMHEEQDISKMGGLKKYMPITYLTFCAGWLAICGVPPFSGFFSKDEVLWKTFALPGGGTALWVLAALTAMMTAFYMTRLMSLTFWGKPRFDAHEVHPHESPLTMTIPLMVLAVASIVGGFMSVPHVTHWLHDWLNPVIVKEVGERYTVDHAMEWVLMGVSIVAALGSIAFAVYSYRDLRTAAARKAKFSGLHKLLENKWYVDEFYEMTLIKPIHRLSVALWKHFDIAVIDRFVLGLGWISKQTGQTARLAQTGSLQVYAFVVLIGLVLTVGVVLYGVA